MNEKKEQPIKMKTLKVSGILALVLVGALLFVGVMEGAVRLMENKLDFLDAGERWSADGSRFAVCALYQEREAAVPVDQALTWAHQIDTALLEASVTPKEGGRSWAYCYGTTTEMTVSGTMNSATAAVVAAGGDFFVFHPLTFSSGAPFLNDSSNPCGVVLDRELAWKLFGAVNVVGFTVTINNVDFTVTGISEKSSNDSVYQTTYGETPRMYMSAAGYAKVVGHENFVTFFEAALPNAVRGFAWNIFDGAVPSGSASGQSAEVTERFALKKRFEHMKTLDYSWVRQNSIELPYWENEASVYDYRAATLIPWEIVFAAVGAAALLASLICLRASGWTLTGSAKKLVTKASKARRDKKKQA